MTLIEIEKILNIFLTLQTNWDGEGASAIGYTVFDATLRFLSRMPEYVIDNLMKDNITPNPSGTISLKWQKNKDYIYLEIDKNNKIKIINSFKYIKEFSMFKIPDIVFILFHQMYITLQ